MTRANADLTEALSGEQQLLDPSCRADSDRLRTLLHPDFREYGASGTVWTRDQIIDRLPGEPSISGEASGFHAEHLAPDVIQVTFTIGGPRPSLRSSIRVRGIDSRWQMRFHQGTLTY